MLLCVRKDRCRVRCVLCVRKNPLQSEVCFCASAKTHLTLQWFWRTHKNTPHSTAVFADAPTHTSPCSGFCGRTKTHLTLQRFLRTHKNTPHSATVFADAQKHTSLCSGFCGRTKNRTPSAAVALVRATTARSVREWGVRGAESTWGSLEIRPQEPLQSEVLFCASAKTAAE